MTPAFSVRTNAHFDRLARTLQKQHADFLDHLSRTIGILSADPYNRTKAHAIKKLTGVDRGDGQYRLRSGRFRFRYDIYGKDVVLVYCGLRREDTYR